MAVHLFWRLKALGARNWGVCIHRRTTCSDFSLGTCMLIWSRRLGKGIPAYGKRELNPRIWGRKQEDQRKIK